MINEVILVCDLDGTLLNESGQVDKTSLENLRRFCQDGGHFIVCTGRMDSDIKYIEEQLGFSGEFRISQNGAVIKNKKNETIFLETIPEKYISIINQAVFSKPLRTEVSDEVHRHFPSPRNPENVAEFVDSSLIIEDLPSYVLKGAISPTIYLTFGESQVFNQIKEDINNNLGAGKVNIVQTSPSSLEIFSSHVSKGEAVKKIKKQLAIDSKNLYIVGDAESDISMFSLSNYSYAVQNAEEEIREKANYYVPTVGDVVDEIYSHRGLIK